MLPAFFALAVLSSAAPQYSVADDYSPVSSSSQNTSDSAFFQAREKILSENRANIRRLVSSRDSIVGIELVVAGETDRSIMSRWGHAMLRFVVSDGHWSQDLVVSFVASVDEPRLSYTKGVFGGYQVLPLVNTLGNFWQDYVRGEERNLYRVIIPTSGQDRQRLVDLLVEWDRDPSQVSDYTFFSNNCAGVLVKFLRAAGLSYHLDRTVVPNYLPDYLERALLNPYPALSLTSLRPTLVKAATVLGISFQDFRNGKGWPVDSAALLEATLTDIEIKRILNELIRMPKTVRAELLKNHSFLLGPGLNEILGFQEIPERFYELCRDGACAEVMLQDEEMLFGPNEVKKARERRRKLFEAYFRSQVTVDGFDGTSHTEPGDYQLRQHHEARRHLELLVGI